MNNRSIRYTNKIDRMYANAVSNGCTEAAQSIGGFITPQGIAANEVPNSSIAICRDKIEKTKVVIPDYSDDNPTESEARLVKFGLPQTAANVNNEWLPSDVRKNVRCEDFAPTTLSNLAPGQRAVIKGISSVGEERSRLRRLGMTDGTRVECVLRRRNIAAFLVKGTLFALRSEDSSHILTESDTAHTAGGGRRRI